MIELVKAVLGLDPEKITAPQRHVLTVLAYHADAKGVAWPAVSTIVRETSLGERTVRRALKELREAGYFWSDQQSGTSSLYTLRWAALTPCQSGRGARAAGVTGAGEAGVPERPEPLPEGQDPPAGAAPNKSVKGQEDLPPPPRASGPHLIPKDWTAEAFGEKTACARILAGLTEQQIEDELERFRAYHEANATIFTDWQAAWKTWVLNIERFRSERHDGSIRHTGRARTGGGGRGGTTDDGLTAELDRRLGLADAAGEAGQPDAGEGGSDSQRALTLLRRIK